jgi:2-phosphosulfolactate phosphatase
MKIHMLDYVDGARWAHGVVVIIDVFRAFSTASYAFAQGASSVIAVGEIDEARRLKSNNPGWILIGERGGKKIDGFDFNNSPAEIEDADLRGKTLILTTNAGTQGLVNATFVNARATALYISSLGPSEVSLVRMGVEAVRRADEDDLCSEYLRSLLLGLHFDVDQIKSHLRSAPSSARFFDDSKPWSPEKDFDLCLDVDRFDFVLQARVMADGNAHLTQVSSTSLHS